MPAELIIPKKKETTAGVDDIEEQNKQFVETI